MRANEAMVWKHYLKQIDPQQYESVVESITDWLGIDADLMVPGVMEIELTDGLLSIAYQPMQRFFAFRSLYVEFGLREGFFVVPAAKAPRIGFSVLSAADGGVIDCFAKWICHSDEVAAIPSFLTLASLLEEKAVAVTRSTIGGLQAAEDQKYLRRLLAEQVDLLRQTQAELRETKRRLLGNFAPGCSAGSCESPDSAWSLEDLADWCATNEQLIIVLPRARRGARNSNYERPDHVVAALELLAGPYRRLRLGDISNKEWEEVLLPTGLRLEGSVAPSIAGEHHEKYFCRWAGRKYFLGLHLLRGGGRDPRTCLRIYFAWESISKRVIVGHMTSHLPNSLT